MARKKTTPAPTKQEDTPKANPLTVDGIDSSELVSLLESRIGESKTHWDSDEYKLEAKTKENEKLYLGKQVSENDDGENENLALDNRIFSSIRTIVPYVTTRVTEPEVYPSSNSIASKKFAEDFEKALHIKADKEKVKQKLKFALEDAIIRRRGYLKPRYDAANKNFCTIEYVPAESIIIDHKAKSYEEPRYFRHVLDKTVEDLITMFPAMEARIMEIFKVNGKNDKTKLRESHKINEDWTFVPLNGQLDLVVCWNYKQEAFGVVKDPNWRYDGENFLDSHMMPLVFINVLNDGRSYIDKTSYVEQAKYLQKTIDARGKQIGENASLGSVGMPVVDSAALADDQAENLTFESDTVIELDVKNAGGSSINDVFTQWKAGSLSPDVYNDKTDAVQGVQNTFGASNIMQGAQSENHTLGQDELLRDMSMGRQQEIVDAIDAGMNRLYLWIAQFLLVYGNDTELFRYVGENATFDYIIMNTDTLDTNAEIRVKSGTSMPIDKVQRRATADKAASQQMIDPLTYWEIMDEPNAEKYAKRLMDFTADPKSFLADTEDEVFNRDAFVDLEIIKQGGQPPFRDNLEKEYFDYLNQFIQSGDLESPKIAPDIQQAIAQFIDMQLARGQKMLGMAETQLPTPEDVQAHNAQVDEAAGAPGAQPPAGGPQGQPGPSQAGPAVASRQPQPVQ